MKDFGGRLAVITGAGSGMGRELAVQLAAAGCNLGLCDITLAAVEETRALCAALAVGLPGAQGSAALLKGAALVPGVAAVRKRQRTP